MKKIRRLHDVNPLEAEQKQLPLDLTPEDPLAMEDEVDKLQKRLEYLKYQANPQIVSKSEVLTQKTKLDRMVDKELEELDKMLLWQDHVKNQMQMFKNTPQMEELNQLYNMLNGKFNDKLFQGMGLTKHKEDDEIKYKQDILRSLREQNINSMSIPLMKPPRQDAVPGMFVPPPSFNKKEQIVAHRYGLTINKDHLVNLRRGIIDETLIDFYLQFLHEFVQDSMNVKERMKREMRVGVVPVRLFADLFALRQTQNQEVIDLRLEQYYLQNYDKIIVPFQYGQEQEYQMVVILVPQFKLVHFYLCVQQNRQPINRRQQLMKQWLGDPAEEKHRQKEQEDTALRIILFWIRRTAEHFKLKQFADQKLWRIRLETNSLVQVPRLSGIYLLQLASMIALGQPLEFYNQDLPRLVPQMQDIIEHVVCSIGISQIVLNPSAIKYFKNEMTYLLQQMNNVQ